MPWDVSVIPSFLWCAGLGGFNRIGFDNRTSRSIPSLCGVGYLQNSPSCALCDTLCEGEQCKQARKQGACTECSLPKTASFILPLVVVILIFPVIEVLITNAESLEISLNFVQARADPTLAGRQEHASPQHT